MQGKARLLAGVLLLLSCGLAGGCAATPPAEWAPGERRGVVVAIEYNRSVSAVSDDVRKAVQSCWVAPGGVLHGYMVREHANPAERGKFTYSAWDILDPGTKTVIAELNILTRPTGGMGYMVGVVQHGPEPPLIEAMRQPARKLEFGAVC